MLEIESAYAEARSDYPGRGAFWNYVLDDSSLKSIAEVEAPGMATWAFKKADVMRTPRSLRLGLRASGKEPLYTTGKDPDRLINWELEVPGVASVTIGSRVYRCLKVYWSSIDEDQTVLAEYYVADTGRTVYLRRYNGPGYWKYEELRGHPEVTYRGMQFRHWYDCLPDHVLIVE
jgi:hypothetical protein